MKLNLTGMKQTFRKVGYFLRRYRPEINTGISIVSSVGSAIFTGKATLKADAIIKESKAKTAEIRKTREEQPDVYSEEDMKKDLMTLKVQTGVKVAKAYAPAVGLQALSIGTNIHGTRILRQENAALAATATTAIATLNEYRKRVKSGENGIESDLKNYNGIEIVNAEQTNPETGKVETVSKMVRTDTNDISMYARFFDVGNPNWRKSPELNLAFLKEQQCYANDRLHADGFIFLNDVYDMLGIPKTEAGQYVGWVDGMGDSFVDFGIYDPRDLPKRSFVNGDENAILLDFNVDGVISDIFERVRFERLRPGESDKTGSVLEYLQK